MGLVVLNMKLGEVKIGVWMIERKSGRRICKS